MRKQMVWLASITIIVVGLIVYLEPVAFARIIFNTINPTAILSNQGREVILTGPLTCTESQKTFMRVTVTQRSTGAVAEGELVFDCSTAQQQWQVHANVLGRETFQPGTARAVAMARTTTNRGETDDANQWLVDVTLLNQ
jgi:hypothetical protein